MKPGEIRKSEAKDAERGRARESERAMDPHYVHPSWGVTPGLDLLKVKEVLGGDGNMRGGGGEGGSAVLQVAPADCRHSASVLASFALRSSSSTKTRIATTLNDEKRASVQEEEEEDKTSASGGGAINDERTTKRTNDASSTSRTLNLVVWEAEAEALARHVLLLAILLDDALVPRERREIFLEVHGNVRVRPRTSDYVAQAGRVFENLLYGHEDSKRGGGVGNTVEETGFGEATRRRLGRILDFSRLKYKEKDALADVFRWWYSTEACSASLMWDWRMRKAHGDRYDSRANIADWDYHQRIGRSIAASSDDAVLENEQVGIIHAVHFREWRDTGVAYELRESNHSEANKTLVTRASGRANEFKDRNGESRGRRVSTVGYWGDVRNPPYLALGIRAAQNTEAAALFKKTNTQHVNTSVDAMERLVDVWVYAIEHGQDAPPADSPLVIKELGGGGDSDDESGDKDFASCVEGVTLTLMTGQLERAVVQKKAFEGMFDIVTVGCLHAHAAGAHLEKIARPGAVLCVERAYFMTEFASEQVAALDEKIAELVSTASVSQRRPHTGSESNGNTESSTSADAVHADESGDDCQKKSLTWTPVPVLEENSDLLASFGRGHLMYILHT